MCIPNRGEDQQGDGCRARKAVDDSYYQRAEVLIATDPAQYAVEAGQRSLIGGVGMRLGLMRMRMDVNEVSVAVGMGVNVAGGSVGVRKLIVGDCGHGAEKSGDIRQAQGDEHDGNGELHAQAEAHWDYEVKKDDGGTDYENSERVPQAPKCAD